MGRCFCHGDLQQRHLCSSHCFGQSVTCSLHDHLSNGRPCLRENCLLEMMDFKSNDTLHIYIQVYLIISYIWVSFRFMFSFSIKHQSDPYQLANCDVRSKSLHRLFFDFLGRWCSSACWKIMGDPERKPNIHWRCWVWPWYLTFLIPWIIWTSQHSERVSYHHQLQSYLHKTW